MKKIFYSMMAVALCSCAQSEVEDVVTPPQPEKKGLKFEVVDNSFTGEDGTRVSYGDYGSDAAYKATFENDDAIGIFAINTSGTDMMVADDVGQNEGAKVPVKAAYKVENAKLTLSNGNWILTGPNGETDVDFTGADLLFAYAPYDENKTINSTEGQDGRPSFIQNADGNWEINKKNNRFFVWPWTVRDNSGDNFKINDWMGAVAKVPASNEEKVTFNMIHMRGMIEVTTDKNVELTELKLGTDAYIPYEFATTENQKVYRILTTEYRSADLIVYATINDNGIIMKYQKGINHGVAGKCSRLNIPYKPAQPIKIGEGGYTSLDAALKAIYGDDYATNSNIKISTLRLEGELQGSDANSGDWATLRKLTTLKGLDMSALTNTTLPVDWLKNYNNVAPVIEKLTSLILPKGLTTIGNDALQVTHVTHIDIPATVKTIATGAFWGRSNLSVRIPEDSALETVGNGVFYDVNAVYTYENNLNLLVLPKSLKTIDGDNAFYSIESLNKVIFKGTTTINDTDAFNGTNAIINVPTGTRSAYEGKFPGKTVYAGPFLTADNYASTYTHPTDGTGTSALCDHNIETYWHSNWGAPDGDATYGQFIDITLPDGVTMNSLIIQYGTRKQNANAVPSEIKIYTSNNDTWGDPLFTLPKEGNSLPTGAGVEFTSDKVDASASFTKIRFAITKSALGDLTAGASSTSTSLSELSIYEDKWTE